MSLAGRAREATRRPGKACSVCTALAVYPPDLAAELAEALDDNAISARALYDELQAIGADPLPGYQQIGHHRRGTCGKKATP